MSPTGDRDVVNLIKDKIDIVSLVERYVKLKKAGKNYSGLCPFHQEKTPSFIVSPDIQRYKCFGCGASGDIFNFIQNLEGLDFPEALEKLGSEVGIDTKRSRRPSKFDALYKLNQHTQEYFENALYKPIGKKTHEYLNERGLSDESLKKFGVGYAHGGDELVKFLQSKDFKSKKIYLDTGVFTDKNGRIRPKFIKRAVFPIKSVSGKVVGFSGRQLPGNDFGPKYLNTPETPIFRKRDLLFGLYESKSGIRKEGFAVLCEGQTDVISAHSIGINNIVAPLGTGITEGQMELLKNYTNTLVLFFDNDTAGLAAVERAFRIASPLGFKIFANAAPEPYKDLDELIQKDPDMAKALITERKDAFTFLLADKIEGKDLENLEDYNDVIKFSRSLINTVVDRADKRFYNDKFKKITGLNVNLIRADNNTNDYNENSGKSSKKVEQLDIEEHFLLLIIKYGLSEKVKHLNLIYFENKDVKEILDFIQKHEISDVSSLSSEEKLSQEARSTIEQVIFMQDSFEPSEADVRDEMNDLYKRIILEYYEKQMKSYRLKLALAEEKDDSKAIEELLKKIMELTNKLSQIKDEK